MMDKMLNVNDIRDMIDYYLNLFQIDTTRDTISCDTFVENSTIGYDTFVKQTIFEVFYEKYLSENKSGESILKFYTDNENQLNHTNEKSHQYNNATDYKKLNRNYKRFRIYQDELALSHDKLEDIQCKDIKAQDVQEKMKGQELRKYQENQLLDVNEFIIFKYIKNGQLSKKNLNYNTIIDALNELEKVYDRIDETYDNFFERSVQYYQLETSCRIETNYLIADVLKNIKRISDEKKKDIVLFKCFKSVESTEHKLENKFTIGLEKYLIRYKENPNFIKDIPIEIFNLNLIKCNIRKNILFYINENNYNLDYKSNDWFFEDYFGRRQYITINKDWDSVLINFRKIYS